MMMASRHDADRTLHQMTVALSGDTSLSVCASPIHPRRSAREVTLMDMEGLRDRSKMNLQVATRFARACGKVKVGPIKLIKRPCDRDCESPKALRKF